MGSRQAKWFGVRLHLPPTIQQIVDQWMVAPAAPHDGTLPPALLEDAQALWVVGDNAFRNPMAKEWRAQHREIALVVLPRRTARPAWPAPRRQ